MTLLDVSAAGTYVLHVHSMYPHNRLSPDKVTAMMYSSAACMRSDGLTDHSMSQ